MTAGWTNLLSSMRRVSFDSNALIYLLEDQQPYAGYVSQAVGLLKTGQATGIVSTIVEMELLVRPLRVRKTAALDKVEVFLRQQPNLFVRAVDRMIARRAADVRARTRLAPLDAIIVATGLEERCDAIIGNDSAIASRHLGIPYLYLDDYVFQG